MRVLICKHCNLWVTRIPSGWLAQACVAAKHEWHHPVTDETNTIEFYLKPDPGYVGFYICNGGAVVRFDTRGLALNTSNEDVS